MSYIKLALAYLILQQQKPKSGYFCPSNVHNSAPFMGKKCRPKTPIGLSYYSSSNQNLDISALQMCIILLPLWARNVDLKCQQAFHTTVVVTKIWIFLPLKCAYFCSLYGQEIFKKNHDVGLILLLYILQVQERGKTWTNSRRHLVILYTRYTTRFSLRSNLVAPLEIMKMSPDGADFWYKCFQGSGKSPCKILPSQLFSV